MKSIARVTATVASAAIPLLVSTGAQAESDYSLSANVTLASDYLFRGITQTNNKPAIQGGFDFAHKSGFYIGNWNSNVSWISDAYPDTSSSIEMDFYGGYKFDLGGGFSLDLGGIYYYYPTRGFDPDPSPNTGELYIGAGFGPLSVKYSQSLTNLFGFADSKNSYYIDGTINYPIPDTSFAVIGHIGYQKVKTDGDCSYTDWKVGGSYGWEGWTFGAYYSDTNANDSCWTAPIGGGNLGDGRFFVSVGRSF